MRLILTALLFAAVAPAHAAAPGLVQDAFAWQWPGEFHGEETIARDRESWLALRIERGEARLEPVEVRVEAVFDPVLDGDDARSGRKVSVPTLDDAPLALVRGGGIAAGPLNSAVHETMTIPVEGVLTLEARDVPSLELVFECDVAPTSDDAESFGCELRVRDGSVQQLLHRFAASRNGDGSIQLGDDGSAELRFAGDLDRDGHLDLVLDLRDHYNVQRTEVWLSRDAAAGERLRRADTHELTGC